MRTLKKPARLGMLALFAALFSPSLASASAPKPTLQMDTAHHSALIKVSDSVTSISINYKSEHDSKWRLFKTIAIKSSPAQVQVMLPADASRKAWQVTGITGVNRTLKQAFPAAYYKNKKSFTSSVTPSYAVHQANVAGSTLNTTSLTANSSTANSSTSTANSTSATPTTTGPAVQADIWKTSGNTAYFFNQLRGLQVIDLSSPTNPLLTAYYRLPAVGQDLYIVPGTGSTNDVLLLTQQYDQASSAYSTSVLMVQVSGTNATLVASNSVPGWLADSRMAGNQLYVTSQQWSWNGSAYQESTILTQLVVDPGGGNLTAGLSQTSIGYSPVISAGDNWLTISQYSNDNWWNSTVTLYSLGTNGATLLTTNPIKLSGQIHNQYALQYTNGILSAISTHWELNTNSGNDNWAWYIPVTTLQNFTPDGTLQGSLQIGQGNWYAAARFSGSAAYVMTGWGGSNYPLYVIDNSQATNPVLAGKVNLPGSVTQLEPLGNQLFTLGYDTNWNVAASLLDVSTPTNPTLLSSVSLPGTWGYSPATYDNKAYNVMTNAGLVTLPYITDNASNGTSASYIQLLSLDQTHGVLSLAGNIPTGQNPLRAAMVGGALASISQRELVTADVSNPTNPTILADLTLAWTVNRAVTSGNYLIEVTDGNSWGETPTATVAAVGDPDSALAQIPLGTGVVCDAKIQGSKLYVLRQDHANSWSWWWGGFLPLCSSRDSLTQSANPTSLTLDIYDASALPSLTLLGSTSTTLPGSSASWDVSGLLFPSTNCVAAIAQPLALSFWWFGPILDPIAIAPVNISQNGALLNKAIPATANVKKEAEDGSSSGACWIYPHRFQNNTPATAALFLVNNPTSPIAEPPVQLTDTNGTSVKYSTAGAGQLVFGYGENEEWMGGSGEGLSRCTNFVAILDLTDPTAPVLGTGITLPGRLKAVTSLSPGGFLAWTESYNGNTNNPGSPQIQVSTCDGVNLYLITSLDLPQGGAMAAAGTNLFTAQSNTVNGYSLDQSGNLNSSSNIVLNWNPSELVATQNPTNTNSVNLLGSDGWRNIFSTTWNSSGPGSVLDDPTPLSTDITKDILLNDGSVLSPSGAYGVDHFLP